MTDTPTPEAVEPMTDADPNMVDLRRFLVGHEGRQGSFRLDVAEGAALVARIDRLESRALPAPRRYTGGPLEDGLYLWRPALWGAGLRDWASIDTSTLSGRYDLKEIVEAEAEVWLIGPIPIPDLPEEEAANG